MLSLGLILSHLWEKLESNSIGENVTDKRRSLALLDHTFREKWESNSIGAKSYGRM